MDRQGGTWHPSAMEGGAKSRWMDDQEEGKERTVQDAPKSRIDDAEEVSAHDERRGPTGQSMRSVFSEYYKEEGLMSGTSLTRYLLRGHGWSEADMENHAHTCIYMYTSIGIPGMKMTYTILGMTTHTREIFSKKTLAFLHLNKFHWK